MTTYNFNYATERDRQLIEDYGFPVSWEDGTAVAGPQMTMPDGTILSTQPTYAGAAMTPYGNGLYSIGPGTAAQVDANMKQWFDTQKAGEGDLMSWLGPALVMGGIGGIALGGVAGAGAAAEGAAGAAGAAGSILPESYWSMLAEGGGAATDAAAAGAGAYGTGGALGLDAVTLGESVLPWTTNPSLAALEGGAAAGEAGGIWQGLQNYFTPTPQSLATNAASQLLQNGGSGVDGWGTDEAGGGLTGDEMPGGGGSGYLPEWMTKLSPSALAQLLGTTVQGASSLLASRAQQQATQNSSNALMTMYNQNRADLAPWREAGVNALGRLTDLTTPGKQFDTMQADPGYQFRLDQGQKALDNRLRAGGKFYSGTALKAGADYNQGFASNEFSNVYNRLAGIAGTGQTATTATGQFGQNAAQGVAANETGMGNARASGYVGVGNAINSGISNYNNQNFQNSLLAMLANNRGY